MKPLLSFLFTGLAAMAAQSPWPKEKAREWHDALPWLVGCNFVPSTAVNDIEMWQAEAFDPETIARELSWAQALGFNTVRVFVNYLVWEADPEGLKKRIDQFLQIAAKDGISTMFVLFDDCFKPEPRLGKQPDPIPGVHNSQWVQSPGASRRDNKAAWPKLQRYVQDIVGTFARDRRVLAWDLYNEPQKSPPLVEAAFRWARSVKPIQPLTATVFGPSPLRKKVMTLSDVISFHHYGPLKDLMRTVASLRTHGRPLLCTEWMARGHGSRFQTHLPYFAENKLACWSWGLVAGRTQTYYPWGSKPNSPEPRLWHHDIFRPDGTPFDPAEVALIKELAGKATASHHEPPIE